ncbi:hypothetical protein RB2083_2676 [Rhodobacteraceae bacterium HTCC2083]|nr:hypothetical protein RB2083_2676 [Rhodobacteraceae bacterium HTCC2083]
MGLCRKTTSGDGLGMDAATTKGVVDRLRGKCWVQSTPSKTDLRRLEISLTEQGRAFAKVPSSAPN